jgi:hypothetical protein
MRQIMARRAATFVPVFMALAMTASSAMAYHGYMRAGETAPGSYTALRSTRDDLAGGLVHGTHNGCNNYFAGAPIYQTQWLQAGSATNWLEMGVAHQCNNQKMYRFMGYGQAGVWHPMTIIDIAGSGTHTHSITSQPNGSGNWVWLLDGVQKNSLSWSTYTSFPQAFAGLESYDVNGIVTANNYAALNYQTVSNGSWTGFSGQDYRDPNGAGLCGQWLSSNDFRMGQNSPC